MDKENRKTKIILIRHGQSEGNAQGIIQGDNFDTPLSDLGKKQAETLAKNLVNFRFDKIFTSTYLRAIQTAERIRNCHPSVPYEELKGLRERLRGAVEGVSQEEFRRRYPEVVEKWNAEIDVRPENGENFEDVHQRVIPIIENHVSNNPGATFLYVIHGNVIRVILGHALAMDFGKRARIKQDYCAINSLEYDHDRKRWEVEYINKTFPLPS